MPHRFKTRDFVYGCVFAPGTKMGQEDRKYLEAATAKVHCFDKKPVYCMD